MKSKKDHPDVIEKLVKRAKSNPVYQVCFMICNNPFFETFIASCIIANTVILALDKYPEHKQDFEILESINLIFFFVFFAEMIVKMLGLGLKRYFRYKFN